MTTKIFDGLTNYLDELLVNVNDKSRKDAFLTEYARELVEEVNQEIPTWNPNLIYSGQDESFWQWIHQPDYASVEIIYTGFTGEGMSEPDDIQVWWEFGKKHLGGYNDILGRDYAYYIEYGRDRYAPNSKVKAPTREPSAFLSGAVVTMGEEETIKDYLMEYFDMIFK